MSVKLELSIMLSLIYIYVRGNFIMGIAKEKGELPDETNKEKLIKNETNRIEVKKLLVNNPIISGVFVIAICGMFGCFVSVKCFMAKYDAKYESFESEFDSYVSETKENEKSRDEKIDDIYKNTETMIQRLENHDNRISNIENRISNIEGIFFTKDALKVDPTGNIITGISVQKIEKYNEYRLSSPVWDNNEIIAIDSNTKEKYKASDLINTNILVPYEQDGNNVLFYGKYNELNHWDGNCIINVYRNDNLILVMDAVYEDGTLKNYDQVIPYNTKSGKTAWIVSQRSCIGSDNFGKSWSYIRNDEYKKTFTDETVNNYDVITAERFKVSIGNRLEGFYQGITSDGNYNDNTGNAYLIKYNDDGTVRTLYKGGFYKGQFSDSSGDAWYITKGEDTNYMYYKGNFKYGGPYHTKNGEFKNDLSLEMINEIIGDYSFESPISWKIE